MNHLIKLTIIFSMTIASFSLGHAETKSNDSAIETLSPDIRDLLTKEMKALQEGMMSIIPAYVSGDWKKIEHTAHKMKNSYIMKQSLTEEQKKELRATLPEAFIKQDQQFHYLAGMLEHVAKEEKIELIGFYFSEMNEACVACHAQYAGHKFPSFSHIVKNTEHNH